MILFIKPYKVVLTFESVDESLKCDHSNEGTEQSFPMVLFIMLYKVVLTFELWMKPQIVTIQMKATEQYFPVVLSTMRYKVVLAFESVDKTLKCDHSDESYRAVFFCGTVQYAVQGGSNFKVFV